jgi:hypothetical protein
MYLCARNSRKGTLLLFYIIPAKFGWVRIDAVEGKSVKMYLCTAFTHSITSDMPRIYWTKLKLEIKQGDHGK